jgi:hypothetical protein
MMSAADLIRLIRTLIRYAMTEVTDEEDRDVVLDVVATVADTAVSRMERESKVQNPDDIPF